MILHTILTAVLALSGTTAAAAIAPRGDGPKANRTVVGPVPAFKVTGFSAVALPLSLRVGYNFNLTISPLLTNLTCFYLGTTPDRDLSSTPWTPCLSPTDPDANTGVSFRWTRHYEGALAGQLALVRQVDPAAYYPDDVVDEAVHDVPADETRRVDPDGQFRRTVYEGPEDFEVQAWRFERDLVGLGLAGGGRGVGRRFDWEGRGEGEGGG
ncbi:hypothetical protein B0T18DRAFT_454049 [Schizothecium vesticola]|uniref:Ubiquitin 3 binding protein But2 C-terminal domain-containing protein n=1 Tax=Schizothecium vesticola TaxID=314040 RepID=A0AA40FAH6_9PEZI|nr:hypothetical protein B0T18DRAFT_454049 [Schizothecium vesticola]